MVYIKRLTKKNEYKTQKQNNNIRKSFSVMYIRVSKGINTLRDNFIFNIIYKKGHT